MKFLSFLFYPVAVLLIALTCAEFFPALMFAFKHLALYQWMLYGIIAYFIIRKFGFFAKNEPWLQTTSHEVTHAIVGMMFFHKIHSLESTETHGVVYHSGRKFGDIFISLAPYCLPVATFALILVRIIGANKMLHVFDILIGFTLAFHIVCFWTQTRPDQPDIQGKGILRSYLFIIIAWLFNSTLILLTIRKGIVGAVTYVFPQYWNDLVSWWHVIF